MILRDYQTKIITDLRKAFNSGYKSPVVVLGCGGGKSIVCANIARMATDKGNRVLFLVHRIELIEQIQDTFNNCGVNMELCDIAMVQSGKKYTADYKMIITDESHHSVCTTYKNIYNRYPNALRVNVTATPCRADNRGLGETCDYLLETVSTKWLIANKYLAPYEYYTVKIADLSGIKKVRGEYEDITELLSKPKIYGDVLKYYKHGSKCICYCSSLLHSQTTADQFNATGVPAAHLDGNTPKDQRKQIVDDFRTGKILVLCNFSILGEGLDISDCDMVMILRKTASLNLFIQMSMRCMRYQKGKTAYIYDFCGNAFEHGLPDDDRQWSLDSKAKMSRNESSEPDILVRQCKSCLRVYSGTSRVCPYCGTNNGLTRKEIEQDEKAELERITEIKKREYKKELKDCKTLDDYRQFGKEHGYADGWAYMRYNVVNKYRNKYNQN